MMRNKLLFIFIFCCTTIFAQYTLIPVVNNEPNDCVNAITVCGNETFYSNASGIGDIQEVSGCGGFEHNSIWLKINIVQSGTLGFDLIPDDPSISVDYDFWVFGPNNLCSNLGSPIRCATTNPLLAGMTNNRTGMYASTTTTQVGPGANGNGYVRWLNVTAGQSYYIAVDRPVGDGGFQIQWTGSATANTGAFPNPPSASKIADLKTCSTTPDVGLFDLNSVRDKINPDLSANEVNFYTSIANAIDGLAPLPNIIGNTSNPQTIYAKVVENVSQCFAISDFTLNVFPVPDASIAISDSKVCSGQNVTVTFTGTPGVTVEYRVNGGVLQSVLLDASGTYKLTETINTDSTYSLVSAKLVDPSTTVICFQIKNEEASVSVATASIPTITTNSPICYGDSAVVNFSGLPNAILSYKVNNGLEQTTTLDSTGKNQVSISALNAGSNAVTLTKITDATAPNCTFNLNTIETIVVNDNVGATLSGTTSVCKDALAPQITFTGTNGIAPYTFTYTINGGANQTISTTSGNSVSIDVPTSVVGVFTYTLVSVSSSTTPICSAAVTDSETVTVMSFPNGTILGAAKVCQNATSPNITFEGYDGVAPYTFTYTINGGANQTITTTVGNSVTLKVPTDSAGTFVYTLVNVSSSTNPICSQVLSNSVSISIEPLPKVSISGTATICSGTATTIEFNGTPNATVAYTIDGGANQSIILNSLGIASVTTPILTVNSTYNVVSTTSFGTPSCTQLQAGAANITVTPLPTVAISGTATVCSGSSATITFSGTPNALVNYTINSGATVTATLSSNGIATITTGNIVDQKVYNLVSASTNASSSICTQSQSGSAIVSVVISPAINKPTPKEVCDDNDDGFITYDLTATVESEVVGTIPNPNYAIAYYYSLADATANQNAIANPSAYVNKIQDKDTVWIVVTNTAVITACKAITQVDIKVKRLRPTITSISGSNTLCVKWGTNKLLSGLRLDSGISDPNYTLQWYLNDVAIPLATKKIYQINTVAPGDYTVRATATNGSACTMIPSAVFTVIQSGPAVAVGKGYTVSNYFTTNQVVTLKVEGFGAGYYQFSLDDGEIVDNGGVFENVRPGIHTVRVYDKKGNTSCDVLQINNILAIDYPRFFTPNGDGFNDFWRIEGLDSSAKIYIFDRYGKVLTALKGGDLGWDGTYNGRPMFSDDYWFTIDYLEGSSRKIFKAHFAIKR